MSDPLYIKFEENKFYLFFLGLYFSYYYVVFFWVRPPGFPGVFRDGLTHKNVGVNNGFGDQKCLSTIKWFVGVVVGFQKKSQKMGVKYPY